MQQEELITVKLDGRLLKALDAIRRLEEDTPSRDEMIRRLIELAAEEIEGLSAELAADLGRAETSRK